MQRMNPKDKQRLSAPQVIAVFWLFLSLILMSTHGIALAEDKALQSLKETGKAFATVAKGASPAVVFIKVEKSVATGNAIQLPDLFRRFFGDPGGPFGQQPQQPLQPQQPPKRTIQGQGSGFIISADGYVLTNNHVVGDAEKVMVKLLDGREFEAKIIGTDPPTDVAVIKIDAKNLPVLPLGDSDKLDVGEWVLALGNPFGLSHSLTAGIVSAKGRSHVGVAEYEDFIQTDAAINPGNSGGPLIDLEGKVIGINTAIYSQSGGSMGIGFAIPVNMAKGVYTQLIKSGSVTRGYLGVTLQELTPDLAKSFKLAETKGVLVSQVVADSPSDKAGLKQGDVIVKLNGEAIIDLYSFRNKVSLMPPGTSVKLDVMRDGAQKALTVKIDKMPAKTEAKASAPVAPTAPDSAKKVGLTVITLTPDLAEKQGVKGEKGVLVTAVEPGSMAQAANMTPGMVIVEVDKKAIKNAKDFEKAVDGHGSDKPLLLLVKEKQGSRYWTIDMKKQ